MKDVTAVIDEDDWTTFVGSLNIPWMEIHQCFRFLKGGCWQIPPLKNDMDEYLTFNCANAVGISAIRAATEEETV